ncbi:MAG: aminoacyl-tRNA hydrolase [Verrucomicrobiales bacterium]
MASGRNFRLIVGLGNPGRQYRDTRHNVGFLVVDALVRNAGAGWSAEKKWEAEVARAGDRFFLKPQTFMNLSGRAVAAMALFYKIEAPEILVVQDDADLPLGALRFRASGSAGGHNGISSIIDSLGTRDFARLKVGIGRREGEGATELAGHVLGKFLVAEAPELEKTLDRAVEAVHKAVLHGLEAAMTEFNRREAKEKEDSPASESENGTEGS